MAFDDFSFHDLATGPLGLVSLVLLGGAVLGAFVFGGQGGFQSTYPASAVFADAAGLEPGAPVEVAGVEVGRVTDVTGDFALGQVVVGLAIEADVDLGAQPRAEIRASNLFGGSVVALSGPVDAPLLAELPRDQRRIPIRRTSVAGGIVEVIDTTTATLDQLDVTTATDVAARMGRVLEGTSQTLPAAVDRLGTLADVVEARSSDLEQLATDATTLTDAFATRQDEIDRLVDAAVRLLDELTRRRDELAVLLGEGDDTVAQLTTFLREHRAAIDQLSADVHEVVAQVGDRTPEIGRSLSLLGPVFQRLAAARGDGPWVEFVSPSFGPISTRDDGLLDRVAGAAGGGPRP